MFYYMVCTIYGMYSVFMCQFALKNFTLEMLLFLATIKCYLSINTFWHTIFCVFMFRVMLKSEV